MQKEQKHKEIKLSQKEQLLEMAAVGLGALWLLGCFLKVLFF